jgi:hypothetical protein
MADESKGYGASNMVLAFIAGAATLFFVGEYLIGLIFE